MQRPARLPTGTLSISGNGIVQLADNVTAGNALGHQQHKPHVLSLTGNGTLDIGNNRIIIDYTHRKRPDRVHRTVDQRTAITANRGPSIISSDIAADDAASGLSYGIGYADGADGAIAGLPSGEIEIMFTLLGDANLDGTVNSEDFTPFSANIGQPGAGIGEISITMGRSTPRTSRPSRQYRPVRHAGRGGGFWNQRAVSAWRTCRNRVRSRCSARP